MGVEIREGDENKSRGRHSRVSADEARARLTYLQVGNETTDVKKHTTATCRETKMDDLRGKENRSGSRLIIANASQRMLGRGGGPVRR